MSCVINPIKLKRDPSPTNYLPGLGYSYSVLVLAVLEYWISGIRTVLVLVSSKVIVLVLVLVLRDKYSGTRTSTGTSTDFLWFICDANKGENHHTFEINSMIYHKRKVPNWFDLIYIYDTWDVITNSIPSFNFIIIEKLTESLSFSLCLLLSFVQVQSLIQLLVIYENFYFRL